MYLPPELLNAFVQHLPSPGTIYDYKQNENPDALLHLIACSTVCRALAAAARPRIFEGVKIWSPKRLGTLKSLMLTNESIALWIKVLHLDGGLSRSCTRNLLLLLGDNDGFAFLTSLQAVHLLRLSGIHPVEQEILRPVLEKFSRLRSVTSLTIRSCHLPPIEYTAKLLASSFPRLQNLDLKNVEFGQDSLAFIPNQSLIPNTLRQLTIHHPRSRSDIRMLQSMASGKHLESLRIGAFMVRGHGTSTFSHYQPLISSASALTNLELFGESCASAADAPDLSSARNLQTITLRAYTDLSWVSHCLDTLPDPSKLQSIKLSAYLIPISKLVRWNWLDDTLTQARFAPTRSNVRKALTLRLNHTSRDTQTPKGFAFVKDWILPRTQKSGWYDIRWRDVNVPPDIARRVELGT